MGDEERNPAARNLGFLAGYRGRPTGVPVGDLPPKPPPPSPILDRFRALLKEREEEFGFSDVPPEEVVRVYEEVLSELTLNSKPIITDLTIIAGEHKDIGEGIADAICTRIVEVPVEQKLPSLYLLDSIVKNIGREYVKYFAARLPEVFCEAYRQVRPSQHDHMRHLFRTWSTVFPSAVLRRIEAELQFSPSVVQQPSSITALRPSESRPSHGIHVNPKYLEARGQLERPTVDLQHSKVGSSSLHTFGRKSAEDAYDQIEDVAGQTDPSRIASGYLSTVSGSDRNALFSKNKMARPSSPINRAGQTLSPLKGSFSRDISPGRVAESVSPLHSKLRLKGEETADWLDRTWSASDGSHPMETSRAYNLSKGNNQRPRALIDAYGSYREKPMLLNEFPKGERCDLNGVTNHSVTRNWQSVEEEEYDWEDMSPTLADRSRGTEHRLIAPSMGSLNVTTGVGRPLSGSELRRRDWNRQSQLSLVGDSAFAPEDRISSLGATGGATIREDLSTSAQNEPRAMLHDTSFSQDSWNLHQNAPLTYPSIASRSGKAHQMPLLTTNGNISSASQKLAPLVDNPPETGFAIQKLLNTRTGIGSSPLDSLGMDKQFSGGPYFPPQTSIVSKNVPTSYPFPSLPSLMPHRQMKSHLDLVDSGKNVAGLVTLRPPNQARENFIFQNVSSQLVTPITNHHVNIQGQEGFRRSVFQNPYAGVLPSLPPHSMRGSSVQVRGGAPPPLPPGPPPVVSQLGLSFQNTDPMLSNPPPGGAFSGLIGSLMAQGLISLTPAPLSQDFLGVEFDVDLLKVRHDSAIDALYVDLPRQCTTCGMRFKSQEEHRSHMDWHVTKNRISKNRKQNPSRKWFVSTKEWLSGAEALGTDIVPGFLPTESVVEKRVDEEMAVPADENQNVCALCGDPFEDFYSDETDEWMYRGAVYMNAADGQVDGMNRSQFGPIVHAKCRSESTGISSIELTQDEVVSNEEHSQRKRMRSSI